MISDQASFPSNSSLSIQWKHIKACILHIVKLTSTLLRFIYFPFRFFMNKKWLTYFVYVRWIYTYMYAIMYNNIFLVIYSVDNSKVENDEYLFWLGNNINILSKSICPTRKWDLFKIRFIFIIISTHSFTQISSYYNFIYIEKFNEFCFEKYNCIQMFNFIFIYYLA